MDLQNMNIEKYNITQTDNYLMLLLDEIGGWEKLVKKYNNASKDKTAKDKSDYLKKESISINNLLTFINIYRKAIIQIIINLSLKKHDNDTTLKNTYKQFLGGKNFSNYFTYMCPGSTNITSDYDCTLLGPISYTIGKNIFFKFSDFSKTLATLFDTNLYFNGIILNKNNINRLEDLKLKLYKVDKDINQYTIIPDTQELINLEFSKLKLKKTDNLDFTDKQIKKKYTKLFKLSEIWDTFLYKNDYKKANIKTKKQFFELLLNMQRESIEAYYTTSTVSIVVWGIQKKNEDKLFPVLLKDQFLISMVENLIDLYNHSSHSKEINYKNVAIKVSKYIYRFFISLEHYLKKSPTVEKKKFEVYLKKNINMTYADLKKIIEDVLFLRKNKELLHKKETKNKYLKKLKLFMNIFKLNKKLFYGMKNPVFDYLKVFDKRVHFFYEKKTHKSHNKKTKRIKHRKQNKTKKK